jgi:Transcriptional regulator, AbiEi antitoxin
VRSRQLPSPALLRLAIAQDGVVTTEQAAGCGLGRHTLARLVEQQQWHRVGYGVYYRASGEIC